MDKNILTILEGVKSDVLTESVKTEIKTLFEGMIKEKVAEEQKKLQEEFDSKINEMYEHNKQEQESKVKTLESRAVEYVDKVMMEKVDEYASHAADEYIKENKLAVEAGIKSDMFDELYESITSIVKKFNIPVDDSKTIVESLQEKNKKLTEELNTKEQELIDSKSIVNGLKCHDVFNKLSEGLTVSQKLKLQTIVEDYPIDDVKLFEEKVKIAKKLVDETKGNTIKESTIETGFGSSLNEDMLNSNKNLENKDKYNSIEDNLLDQALSHLDK